MSLDFLIFDRIKELMRIGHGCGLGVCLDSYNNTVMDGIAHLRPVNPVWSPWYESKSHEVRWLKWNQQSPAPLCCLACAGCMALSITSSITLIAISVFFGAVKWICQLPVKCCHKHCTDYLGIMWWRCFSWLCGICLFWLDQTKVIIVSIQS